MLSSGSPRFRCCPSCKGALQTSDGNSKCLYCLGELHIPSRYAVCMSFSFGTRKDREAHVQVFLITKSTIPTSEPSSLHSSSMGTSVSKCISEGSLILRHLAQIAQTTLRGFSTTPSVYTILSHGIVQGFTEIVNKRGSSNKRGPFPGTPAVPDDCHICILTGMGLPLGQIENTRPMVLKEKRMHIGHLELYGRPANPFST